MIITLPLLHLHLPFPSLFLQRLFKRLGPELTILVKLIVGPIVDSHDELLILGPRREEERRVVRFPFFLWRGEVAGECFLAPLALGRVAVRRMWGGVSALLLGGDAERTYAMGAKPEADLKCPGFLR